MQKFLFVSAVFFFCYHSLQSTVEGKASFTIDLVHRDSPLSPSYDKSLTPPEIVRRIAVRSKARASYFNSFASKTSNVVSTVHPNVGEYLMKLYIGTPPIPFLAIADTGSDLIWVKCTNCKKCFSPSNSSTYSTILCSTQACEILPRFRCSVGANKCVYDYRYSNGSTFTKGILSSDTISLDSTNAGEIISFSSSVFGCSYDYVGNIFDWPSSGLVGLGGGALSLVSQLGDAIDYKFAYCLLHYSSKYTSKLKFGHDAILSGPSTPLITDPKNPTFYYLSLLRLSVGKNTTQTPQSPGNIIIDSGTTLTYLKTKFYNEFELLVRLAIPLQQVKDPNNIFSLCFNTSSASSVEFPSVTFHFDGADLIMTNDNLFLPYYNKTVCMSVVPTDGVSIFGNWAQMHHAVGYDLKLRKVTFAAANCKKF